MNKNLKHKLIKSKTRNELKKILVEEVIDEIKNNNREEIIKSLASEIDEHFTQLQSDNIKINGIDWIVKEDETSKDYKVIMEIKVNDQLFTIEIK